MIKLSVSKRGFILIRDSVKVVDRGSSLGSGRVAIIANLERGIAAFRKEVKTNELLVIELPDETLVKWVNGAIPPKAERTSFEKCYEGLQSLRCKFLCVKRDKLSVDGVYSLSKPSIPVALNGFNFD